MPDIAALAAELRNAAYATPLAAAQTAITAFPLAAPSVNDAAVAAGLVAQQAAVAALQAIAAAVNARTISVNQVVSDTTVKQFMFAQGIVGACALAAANTELTAQERAACQTLRDAVLNGGGLAFDLTNVAEKAAIDAACAAQIAAGVMTADQQTALYALGTVSAPAWKPFSTRPVDFNDVLRALGKTWENFTVPATGA